MLLGGRLLVTILSFSACFCSELKKPRHEKRLFALLGYLHGYKIGFDYASQLSPAIPVIILPTINQHQTVSILKTVYASKYADSKNKSQTLKSLAELSMKDSTNLENELIENEVKPRDSVKRNTPAFCNNTFDESDMLRQAVPLKDETTISNNQPEVITVLPTTAASTEETTMRNDNVRETGIMNEAITTTETIKGLYPTANYENGIVDTLTLTTIADEIVLPPLKDNIGLPPLHDKRWQNFDKNGAKSTQKIYSKESGKTAERNGPYSPAVYDDKINQIYLTTEMYVKDQQQPPANDFRWQKFSTNKVVESSGQFKPLAGLYYDGFLNTPVEKQEFIPKYGYNKYYY